MENDPIPVPPRTFAEVTQDLKMTEQQLLAKLAAISKTSRELVREEQTLPHRRNGAASADRRKYELGSVMTLLQLDVFDDSALLGLFLNPNDAIDWLILASRAPNDNASFGELIGRIFEIPQRLSACIERGKNAQLAALSRVYHQEVVDFIGSGRAGCDESWRGRHMTVGQQAVISRLERITKLSAPADMDRGQAHDWIFAAGGDPSFWFGPECVK